MIGDESPISRQPRDTCISQTPTSSPPLTGRSEKAESGHCSDTFRFHARVDARVGLVSLGVERVQAVVQFPAKGTSRLAEGCVKSDGGAGEGLAYRAVGLGAFGGQAEPLSRQARYLTGHAEVDAGDALSGLERNVGTGFEPLGSVARRWPGRSTTP